MNRVTRDHIRLADDRVARAVDLVPRPASRRSRVAGAERQQVAVRAEPQRERVAGDLRLAAGIHPPDVSSSTASRSRKSPGRTASTMAGSS
jgi:hypothetical protein